MKKTVIIIGGGISGLTSGIYAKLNGYDAVILEKNHVLGGIPKNELPDFEKALQNTVLAVEEMLKSGIESAMNKFNS